MLFANYLVSHSLSVIELCLCAISVSVSTSYFYHLWLYIDSSDVFFIKLLCCLLHLYYDIQVIFINADASLPWVHWHQFIDGGFPPQQHQAPQRGGSINFEICKKSDKPS